MGVFNVFIVGFKGFGVEIVKNIALVGVKSFIFYDSVLVVIVDFFL